MNAEPCKTAVLKILQTREGRSLTLENFVSALQTAMQCTAEQLPALCDLRSMRLRVKAQYGADDSDGD